MNPLRRVHGLRFAGSFVLIAAVTSIYFALVGESAIFKLADSRHVPGGRVTFPSEGFKPSPFILDEIFNSAKDGIVMFRNAEPPEWRLGGEGASVFRFYAARPGALTLSVDRWDAAFTPRVLVLNDQNLPVATATWTAARETPLRGTIEVPAAGVYQLRAQFRSESVAQISVAFKPGEGRAQSYGAYLRKTLKTIQIQLIPGQHTRMRRIMRIQAAHWKIPDLSNFSTRNLPSVKEGIQGQIRTGRGTWATVEIEMAGRNRAHLSNLALPSMDITVRAGELPFGLRRFKLYLLSAKTNGRDMLMETTLADSGLLGGRQDIVRVVLNGKHVGYYQLFEDIDDHFFEYMQVTAAPVTGYDTDALIANDGKSHYKPRGYYRADKLFAYAPDQDPSSLAFPARYCPNAMSSLAAFAATYAGNHAMGNDLRFHIDAQRDCIALVLKDMNTGVNRVSSGGFANALRQFSSVASSWRPLTATYGSYFVLRSESSSRQLPFYWWLWTPADLNFFQSEAHVQDFLRQLKFWGEGWNHDRVKRRAQNFKRAAAEASKSHWPLQVNADVAYARPQDKIDPRALYAPLDGKDAAARAPQSEYVAKLLDGSRTDGMRADAFDIRVFGWRNSIVRNFLTAKEKGSDEKPSDAGTGISQVLARPAVSVLYRREDSDYARLVLVERSGEETFDDAAAVTLTSEAGQTYLPAAVASAGSRSFPIRLWNVLMNDIQPEERVRLHTFRVKKTREYQYLRVSVRGNLDYVGPWEIVILPADPEPARAQAPADLNEFFEVHGGELHWRDSAGNPDRSIVIPEHYTWVVDRPTEVRYGPKGCMEIRGGVKITESGSLRLLSSGQGWNGVHFIGNADLDLSRLEVEGAGIGETKVHCNSRSYTGGLTFYNTRARLMDFKVHESRSEDGIHILRSDVQLENGRVWNTMSDAIDSDYSSLLVRNVTVEKGGELSGSGGDGLDVSGTFARVEQSRLIDNGDKGLSIGENSYVVARTVIFSGGHYGIAVKDGSHLDLTGGEIHQNRIGIASYVKKPFFSFPTTDLHSISLMGNGIESLYSNQEPRQ